MPWERPMVGVILCSKARFFSAASTLSTSATRRSAARVSCTLRQGARPGGADDLRQMGQEGDDVVLGFALDLVDPGDVEGRILSLGPDGPGGLFRDHAEFRLRVRRMRLDLEPDLEARLRLPEGGHL